jgi:hypothetical protein
MLSCNDAAATCHPDPYVLSRRVEYRLPRGGGSLKKQETLLLTLSSASCLALNIPFILWREFATFSLILDFLCRSSTGGRELSREGEGRGSTEDTSMKAPSSSTSAPPSTTVVDLLFPVVGPRLPTDHGYLLYSAMSRVLPCLHDGSVSFAMGTVNDGWVER